MTKIVGAAVVKAYLGLRWEWVAVEDSLDFIDDLVLNLRVVGDQEGGEGQGRRRRLVPEVSSPICTILFLPKTALQLKDRNQAFNGEPTA